MNSTNLGYKGIVNAKLNIGNKIVELKNHNEGTPTLFKSFARFLTNNSVYAVDTPQYLDLQYKENKAGADWKTWLSKTISFTGREYYYDEEFSNWAAKFSAVIIHSNLIQTITDSMDEEGTFRLVMYSGTNEDIQKPQDLAYLVVSSKDLARIVPGTQAIIEWVMMVTNV